MKRILLFLLFVLHLSQVFAEDNVKVSVSAPSSVVENQTFKIVFSIQNATADSFRMPKIKGLRLISGPSKSSSTSTTIVGGRMVMSTSVSLAYLAVAEKTGDLKIPSASIWSGGKSYATKETAITVLKQSVANKKQAEQSKKQEKQSKQKQSIPQANPDEIRGEDVFVKTEWENSNVCAGKHNKLFVKLYYRVNVIGLNNIEWPEIKNCEVTDAQIPRNSLYGRAQVNGVLYNTVIVGIKDIVPSKTGKLNVNSGSLDVIVNVPNKNDFWGGYHKVSQHLVIPGLSCRVGGAEEKSEPESEPSTQQQFHWNL